MTKALEKTKGKELQQFNQEELDLIKKTVAKDATDNELRLFLYTAGMRGLNPLTRQIHFVVRGKGENRQGVIQTGIDGFRLIANRSGKYAPSPKPTIFEYANGKLSRATVFGMKIVGNQAFEGSATAKFSEYYVATSPMWSKMPETMLEKCAEAKLLRRLFPEDLSGLYADEEMEQAGTITVHPAEIPGGNEKSQDSPGEESHESNGVLDSIDPDNPYSHFLHTCPTHGETWGISKKFNKESRFHKLDDGTYCNFKDQITKELGYKAKQLNLDNKWDFAEWCKKHFDGATWSKMSEEQQVKALLIMDEQIAAKTPQEGEDPVVAEAKRLGAVVVPGKPKQAEMNTGDKGSETVED